MNQLDTYYRALTDYKKATSADRECEAFLRAIIAADSKSENITVVRNVCTVEEDWVNAIEEGLVHVEKAIKEERQFILSNGEVVPIEKAKNVSTESVRHLAKHSNLITREQEGDDIIPDAIYTVERLNDYTVYENRFLYMLLCYLREFIVIRQDKIVELTHKYCGCLRISKEVVHGKRRLTYNIELDEERRDDPYLREHNSAKEMIDRISLLLKTVLAFLATPLMEDAAKAPMLKPPITKTNVLKMDKHFKGAVALYDYIMAYDKLGYSIEEKRDIIAPFGRELSGEAAGVCSVLSFMTYEYGLDIKADLKREYEKEEERRHAEEIGRHKDQLAALKRRMENDEISADEYILSLEKQVKTLEDAYLRMEKLSDRIDRTDAENRVLRDEAELLENKNKELLEQIDSEMQKHFEETETLKRECEKKLADTTEKYENELGEAKQKYNEELRTTKEACHEKIIELNAELDKTLTERDTLTNEYAELLEEKRLSEAMMKAMRAEKGTMDGDYSDKKSFDELEREYAALTKFYNQQWSKAKKEIRKNLLSFKALKGQKGNDDEQ